MVKKIIPHLFILIASVVLVFLVPLFEVHTINNHTDLENISCGWPLVFSRQDQSRIDPPLPWKVRCEIINLEDPIRYYLPYFVIDAAFFYIIFLSVFYVAVKFKLKTSDS